MTGWAHPEDIFLPSNSQFYGSCPAVLVPSSRAGGAQNWLWSESNQARLCSRTLPAFSFWDLINWKRVNSKITTCCVLQKRQMLNEAWDCERDLTSWGVPMCIHLSANNPYYSKSTGETLWWTTNSEFSIVWQKCTSSRIPAHFPVSHFPILCCYC